MSKSSIRQYIEEYYPQYYSIETYPASECVRIHKITEPWGVFSNFFHTPITVEGVTFDTSERLYQTMKFIDSEAVRQVYGKKGNPKMTAKRLFNEGFQREDWGQMLVDAMKFCLTLKYQQNEEFRKALEDSKGKYIVEDQSTFTKKTPDTWGVKLQGDSYVGPNLLGRLLMELRDNGKLEYTLPDDALRFTQFLSKTTLNTIGICPEIQYNNSITAEDITKESAIDSTALKVLTYSHPHDTCDGIELHLGNQAMGYPFTCLDHSWKAVEYLYLCGEWSWEGEDAKAIQEDVLTAKSGYAAATYKRTKYKKRLRADYETFRDQWMLWCVWQKCLGNEAYRKHLLSMPEDRVIIEVIKRDKVWAAWPDDNGIYHGANGMGKILTICRRCLKEGTSPAINTDLLNSKSIYILGEKVQF